MSKNCMVFGFGKWGSFASTTVDGRIPNNHLGCRKPSKKWDKLQTSTGAGFQP